MRSWSIVAHGFVLLNFDQLDLGGWSVGGGVTWSRNLHTALRGWLSVAVRPLNADLNPSQKALSCITRQLYMNGSKQQQRNHGGLWWHKLCFKDWMIAADSSMDPRLIPSQNPTRMCYNHPFQISSALGWVSRTWLIWPSCFTSSLSAIDANIDANSLESSHVSTVQLECFAGAISERIWHRTKAQKAQKAGRWAPFHARRCQGLVLCWFYSTKRKKGHPIG